MATPRSKTDLNTILTFGVDQKNRTIDFGIPVDGMEYDIGDFTQASVAAAVRAIRTMALDAPNKPITIYMNSYGGDPYAMLCLKDVILTTPCQFKFYGGGAIMSSASWVMCVCDERYLYEDATIMIHNGWESLEDRYNDIHIIADESKRLMGLLWDCYATNSYRPREFWEDVCQRDLYLVATEAIQLGLADKIVKQVKRGNLRKMRTKHLSNPPTTRTTQILTKRLYDRVGVNPPGHEIKINDNPNEKFDDSIIIDETPMEDRPKEVENDEEKSE